MTMIDEANAGWRRARIVIEVYIVRCRRLYSSMLRRHMMTGQETSHPSWRIRGRLWGTPMRTETLRLLAAQDEMLSFVIRTRPRADRRVRHRRKMNEFIKHRCVEIWSRRSDHPPVAPRTSQPKNHIAELLWASLYSDKHHAKLGRGLVRRQQIIIGRTSLTQGMASQKPHVAV